MRRRVLAARRLCSCPAFFLTSADCWYATRSFAALRMTRFTGRPPGGRPLQRSCSACVAAGRWPAEIAHGVIASSPQGCEAISPHLKSTVQRARRDRHRAPAAPLAMTANTNVGRALRARMHTRSACPRAASSDFGHSESRCRRDEESRRTGTAVDHAAPRRDPSAPARPQDDKEEKPAARRPAVIALCNL